MSSTQRTVIIGVFYESHQAQEAVEELRGLGFTEEQIGIAYRSAASSDPDQTPPPHTTYADEGALAGGIAGAGLGGLWAIGIAVGILPALGTAIAGGILASLLLSTAVGAVTGGVVGALLGVGIPEDEVRYYEEQFRAGRTLVTVRSADRLAEAQEVFQRHGAYNIDTDERLLSAQESARS